MARKKESQRIPRPPNAFILYRSHITGQLPPPSPGTYRKQGDISRMVSELWHNESQAVKAEYQQLALIKKLEHEAKYPGYKYSPRSKEQREREKRTRSSETNSGVHAGQVDFHDAFSATGYYSMSPSLSTGLSTCETTPPTWNQQDVDEAFRASREDLGRSDHHVCQPWPYAASYGPDVQLATDPLISDHSSASLQAYGEYVPSSYEASFDSMLRELTGGQLDHWHQV